MKRLACVLLVGMAACGGSGFNTGEASLTNVMPEIKSAGAVSFTGADGNGTMVQGWTINLFSADANSDCVDAKSKLVGSIGIYSSQTPDMADKAQLQTGDIAIVTTAPPPVNGNAAANMGAEGISNIVGTVTITNFHLTADLTADLIEGTINAGGMDSASGSAVSLTGMFSAPVCE
jgi:hypothetical protein